ncbi:redoxin domain-containing protein [Dethiobacter alkaliphilus]|uniref:redoxin domain-containing protein n=1 Tax=Dethiobacter alkaliphilus TaxID=427926 RepID=UPI002225E7F7|nr:redoxin domain-containing protein [Dethiobacter alkaliphilus]MCW3491635.1 redoxin domain-containing protein [Dethiobacter alkaliphilus]
MDFLLKDQNGTDIRLSDYKGKKVLLSFHPLAWTSVCSDQMSSLEENREKFAALNTVALGLSVDSLPCKKAWADSLGISGTSLLCDFWPHGDVASQYGVFREKHGTSERANIIFDENGREIFRKIYPIKELPDINEIIERLKNPPALGSTDKDS